MDVERTIEFILQTQAKAEARMDKFDTRLEATRKLVQTGMKMLVKINQQQLVVSGQLAALAGEVRVLTEAQRKTDRKFDRMIDSWTKRRSNGHRQKS
jgi:hypothetical protein